MRHVRPIDLEEITKASGKELGDTPIRDLKTALVLVNDNNEVYSIGNVEISGLIWMITTTRIETNKIKFLRWTKKHLAPVLEAFGEVHNIAYLKNDVHVKWLSYLGAEWGDLTPDGEFQHFSIKKRKEKQHPCVPSPTR